MFYDFYTYRISDVFSRRTPLCTSRPWNTHTHSVKKNHTRLPARGNESLLEMHRITTRVIASLQQGPICFSDKRVDDAVSSCHTQPWYTDSHRVLAESQGIYPGIYKNEIEIPSDERNLIAKYF